MYTLELVKILKGIVRIIGLNLPIPRQTVRKLRKVGSHKVEVPIHFHLGRQSYTPNIPK